MDDALRYIRLAYLKERNVPNKREADQLAIYKHDRRVDLGSTKKQLQLSGERGT